MTYERRLLGQITRFLLQESLEHAKKFSQMQSTLTKLESMMSTANSVETTILSNVVQIVTDLGSATTDLKQLLTDQAAAIAALQAQIAAGTASPQFTADQLATLQNSTTGALAGVDALDGQSRRQTPR
jgi:phage terminase large subunit-like protein